MQYESTDEILKQLAGLYAELSPQLRRAAQYLLDNPNQVGVHSMRQIATEADVHPNTLVRLARSLGFDNYQEFRQPFRESLTNHGESFPDRARWLQSLAAGHSHGQLFSQIAASNLANIEQLFSGTTADEVKLVADKIVASRFTYVLGVGAVYSMAHNFWYVTRMAMDKMVQLPRIGSLPSDDLLQTGPDDLLIAMTFHPFRADVVDAVKLAKSRGMTIVAITDSRSSPIALEADHVFVVPNRSPQFFSSLLSTLALLEMLTSFIIADADPQVIAHIEEFHRKRHEAGVYWQDD